MRCVAFAFVCVTVPAARAAEPAKPNAALQYWQAFAAVPGPKGLNSLTEDEQGRVAEWETAPLDGVAATALKKYWDALAYLHRGAATPYCFWGSQLDLPRDGIGTRCPQGARSHDLRYAALLRARYRFAHGQPRRAVDDLFALLHFARHLDVGSSLVGLLVGYAIERDVIRVLGAHMCVLAADADLLASTKAKWAKLPPARPVVDAMREERDGFLGWSATTPDSIRMTHRMTKSGPLSGSFPHSVLFWARKRSLSRSRPSATRSGGTTSG